MILLTRSISLRMDIGIAGVGFLSIVLRASIIYVSTFLTINNNVEEDWILINSHFLPASYALRASISYFSASILTAFLFNLLTS